MSGGVVFVRIDGPRGIDREGIRARLAKGAKVHVGVPHDDERSALRDLLGGYRRALLGSGQDDDARTVRALADDPLSAFLAIRPGGEVVDQTVSTE